MPILGINNQLYYTTEELTSIMGASRYAIHNKSLRLNVGCSGEKIGLKESFGKKVKFFTKEELNLLKMDFRLASSQTFVCLKDYFEVSCGEPIEVDGKGGSIYIPAIRVKKILSNTENYYILHARGDSMQDIGIHDGDLLLISRTKKFSYSGEVVVANVNGQSTLKQIFPVPNNPNMYELRPFNKDKPSFFVEYPDQLRIQGVLVENLKDLN